MPTRKLPSEIKLLRQSFHDLLMKQIGRCEHPECPYPNNCYPSQLIKHEALVPVAFMQGVRRDPDHELLKHILFHPINVPLLHNSPCHIEKRPSREEAFLMVSRRSDRFYSMFQLHSFVYAAQHFFMVFKRFQEKGIIKYLPHLPENYMSVLTAKGTRAIFS